MRMIPRFAVATSRRRMVVSSRQLATIVAEQQKSLISRKIIHSAASSITVLFPNRPRFYSTSPLIFQKSQSNSDTNSLVFTQLIQSIDDLPPKAREEASLRRSGIIELLRTHQKVKDAPGVNFMFRLEQVQAIIQDPPSDVPKRIDAIFRNHDEEIVDAFRPKAKTEAEQLLRAIEHAMGMTNDLHKYLDPHYQGEGPPKPPRTKQLIIRAKARRRAWYEYLLNSAGHTKDELAEFFVDEETDIGGYGAKEGEAMSEAEQFMQLCEQYMFDGVIPGEVSVLQQQYEHQLSGKPGQTMTLTHEQLHALMNECVDAEGNFDARQIADKLPNLGVSVKEMEDMFEQSKQGLTPPPVQPPPQNVIDTTSVPKKKQDADDEDEYIPPPMIEVDVQEERRKRKAARKAQQAQEQKTMEQKEPHITSTNEQSTAGDTNSAEYRENWKQYRQAVDRMTPKERRQESIRAAKERRNLWYNHMKELGKSHPIDRLTRDPQTGKWLGLDDIFIDEETDIKGALTRDGPMSDAEKFMREFELLQKQHNPCEIFYDDKVLHGGSVPTKKPIESTTTKTTTTPTATPEIPEEAEEIKVDKSDFETKPGEDPIKKQELRMLAVARRNSWLEFLQKMGKEEGRTHFATDPQTGKELRLNEIFLSVEKDLKGAFSKDDSDISLAEALIREVEDQMGYQNPLKRFWV